MQTVEQLSIFLENRAGRLAEVTRLLSEANINIRALSLADTSDFGILRLIVQETAKAQEILRAKGFTLGLTQVVAILVPNSPGSLHKILGIVSQDSINIEYMYAFSGTPSSIGASGSDKDEDSAIMIFRFDNSEKAIQTLSSQGFKIISQLNS